MLDELVPLLFLILLALAPVVLWVIWKRILRPRIKGAVGEVKVKAILSFLPKEYKVINNVILPTPKGTTQIDHVVLSPYAVFAIETKNYKGWIFGSENQRYWTQNIFGRKGQLRNPIYQNLLHIKALKILFSDMRNVPFVSIVAFSSSCTLKINVKSHVVYFRQINKVIKSYQEIALSKEEVENAYFKIINIGTSSKNLQFEHAKNTDKKRKASNEKVVTSLLCPGCGEKLIRRIGKYGKFFGCSKYPKCKYTRKIEG